MIKFYKRNDWKSLVEIIHQSSDESHTEVEFNDKEFKAEKDYFLEYLFNEKRKIEYLEGEEIYFAFNQKFENNDLNEVSQEVNTHIPLNLESLMIHLKDNVLLDNGNLLFNYYICGYYEGSGYECNEQLFYIKKTDLLNYLNNNIDTSTFFSEKLIEFKFNENKFYELRDSCLRKKKELNTSEHELQYKADTSILNYDFITALDNQELSISNVSGLIGFDFKEYNNSDNGIEDEIPF